LFLAYQFMSFVMHRKTILVSSPTWPNHIGIGKLARYESVREYRYWDNEKRCLDFTGMLQDINSAPNESVIVLHACAHNPTGMDLTKEQWIQLADVLKSKHIFPIFDIAYQGFASGDLDRDAWAVRYYAEQGFELFVCQSFSKNFGLYNERVGNLCIVTNDAAITGRVKSQMKILVRQAWSNPPNHGCRIVATVLSNPALFAEWKGNVKLMADRVILMRQMLFQKLQALGTPGSWQHVINQIGMFSFTGLTKNQVDHIRNKYHIYMLSDGRVNMCGLNNSNVDYVAKAIDDAVRNI